MTVIGLISDTHRSQCHSDMSDVLYLQVSVTVTCLMSYTYRSVSDTYRSVSQWHVWCLILTGQCHTDMSDVLYLQVSVAGTFLITYGSVSQWQVWCLILTGQCLILTGQCHSDMSDVLYLQVSVAVTFLITYGSVSQWQVWCLILTGQCQCDMSDVLYLQVSVTVTGLISDTYRSVSQKQASCSPASVVIDLQPLVPNVDGRQPLSPRGAVNIALVIGRVNFHHFPLFPLWL